MTEQNKWPAWKRIESVADLPEREGWYLYASRVLEYPTTAYWEKDRGCYRHWIEDAVAYVPVPITEFEEGE